jgi:sugar phosphate isomerase/epimerase
MPNPLILISTGSLKFLKYSDIFSFSKKVGFDGIELYLEKPEMLNKSLLKELSKLKEKHNIPILSLHIPSYEHYFFKFISSPLRVGEEVLKKSLNFAKKLGCESMVVHPFPAMFFKEKVKENFLFCLNKIKGELPLCIEILPKFLFLLPHCLVYPSEFLSFCKKNSFKMTLDTTHCLSIGKDPKEVFKLCKDVVWEIHFSDFYKGKQHLPLGFGKFKYKEFLNLLKENKFTKKITLEFNPKTIPSLKIIKENLLEIKEIFKD